MVMSDEVRADQIRASIDLTHNVSIEVVPYDLIHEHLMRAVAEGDAPDVAMIDHVWVAEFAESYMIYPLDELNPTWLNALVTKPDFDSESTGENWCVLAKPSDLKDMWGRELRYELGEDANGKPAPKVMSNGPDGDEDTDDDITLPVDEDEG